MYHRCKNRHRKKITILTPEIHPIFYILENTWNFLQIHRTFYIKKYFKSTFVLFTVRTMHLQKRGKKNMKRLDYLCTLGVIKLFHSILFLIFYSTRIKKTTLQRYVLLKNVDEKKDVNQEKMVSETRTLAGVCYQTKGSLIHYVNVLDTVPLWTSPIQSGI